MAKTITLSQLQKLGACKYQLSLFKKRFGESVTLTEEIVLTHCQDFNINWLIDNLLTPRQKTKARAEYDKAWVEYDKAVAELNKAIVELEKTWDELDDSTFGSEDCWVGGLDLKAGDL